MISSCIKGLFFCLFICYSMFRTLETDAVRYDIEPYAINDKLLDRDYKTNSIR